METLLTRAAPARPRDAARSSFPETLSPHWQRALAASDAAVICAAWLLAAGRSQAIVALLAAAILCAVAALCGYYRRSFAVTARDEIYASAVVAALALVPFALVAAQLQETPPWPYLAAALLSIAGMATMRTLLHQARRSDPQFSPSVGAVTRGAIERAEGALLSKRVFDVALASLALAFFAPVMLVAAIAVYAESGAPVFFRQERIGRHDRPFSILKFRTMRVCDDATWAHPGDARITRVGAVLRRTSLDELPQLFNVLAGEMSLVGARPEMRSYAERFARAIPHYEQRHVLAPGITGWAQIHLKRNLQPSDMPEVLPYDLFYVQHASRFLDATIVIKTAAEFLFHRAV